MNRKSAPDHTLELLRSALQSLPHGPEFRFIDRLLELAPGHSGVAEYRVRGDEPYLRGHFPGRPIFPGVLMLEGAAQLAGAVAQSDPNRTPAPELRLAAVRAVKITGTAEPGQTIQFRARIIGRHGDLIQAEVAISLGERTILRGEITLSEGQRHGHSGSSGAHPLPEV